MQILIVDRPFIASGLSAVIRNELGLDLLHASNIEEGFEVFVPAFVTRTTSKAQSAPQADLAQKPTMH
jgi:hypothetical protein